MLLAGVDIPLPSIQVNLHQPTIKEIGYISEENFFLGCELLKFSKEDLTLQDKDNLKDQTNFDIIMSIMNDGSNIGAMKNKVAAQMTLTIIFPTCQISMSRDKIILVETNDKGNEVPHALDNSNYEEFRNALIQIAGIYSKNDEQTYNPGGDLAAKIADKFKKRQQKLAQQNNLNSQKVALLSRYVSILSVGLQKDMNDLLNYTIYQLNDEFQRYMLKVNYDIYVQAKMAGAQDLEEVEDWLKDIHP